MCGGHTVVAVTVCHEYRPCVLLGEERLTVSKQTHKYAHTFIRIAHTQWLQPSRPFNSIFSLHTHTRMYNEAH